MWPEHVLPDPGYYSQGADPPSDRGLHFETGAVATDPLEAITGLELMLGLMGWLTLLAWQFLRQMVSGRPVL